MTEAVLAGRTILVVEDEGLIARELSNALESAGAEIITARGVMDATRIIESRKLSAAVLDFWLGVGVDCLRICDLLTEQGVPFLLYTSYRLLEGAPKAPIVGKLAPPSTIVAGVADLLKEAVRSFGAPRHNGKLGARPLPTFSHGAVMLVENRPPFSSRPVCCVHANQDVWRRAANVPAAAIAQLSAQRPALVA